jgi:hypothetical protein
MTEGRKICVEVPKKQGKNPVNIICRVSLKISDYIVMQRHRLGYLSKTLTTFRKMGPVSSDGQQV